jgi:sarcosine oxidase subunit beta
VAIIGGGTAGCSTALHLRKRGVPCVLLERVTCGSQASGVNYGGVRQQGRAFVELPLARRSRAMWERLPELVGVDVEFAATGHLKLARLESEVADLEAWNRTAAEYGVATELFGANAVKERYPWLGVAVAGASLCREDGQANPRLVAPAFAQAARKAGAEIHEHTSVLSAEKAGDRFRIATDRGVEIDAASLVNTAGAWGHRIAAMFGEPVPETVAAPNMIVTEPMPFVVTHNLGVVNGGVYLRQIPRGNIIFGGGRGWADPDKMRARPLAATTLAAFAAAAALVPMLARAHAIRTWTGIEGEMPDAIPVIGPSRTTAGLFHAFGFSGHGFQLGPVIGAILSELVLDGATPTPIDAFAIDRFRVC